jgi:hypothetical protein
MARKHQVYSARELLSLQEDPNRWIVKDMMQKCNRIFLFGEGGSYKSAISFDLCVAIASGGRLLRQIDVLQHGPVFLNSTEGSIFDNRDRLLSHIRAHGVNPFDMPLYICQQPFGLDDATDIIELEGLIKKHKPMLVMLDPLDSFFSGDENSSKETKALRRTVDRLIDEYKCAFLIIHHQTKVPGGDKNSKSNRASLRGSSAWYGWADAVLHVKLSKKKLGLPEPTEIITLESLKQRNGPKGHMFSAVPIIDKALNHTTFVYFDGKDASAVVRGYFKSKLYSALRSSDQPMTNLMLAEMIGVRQERIVEALADLEKEGMIVKDGEVKRAFGTDGSRSKKVPAWRPLVPLSIVDAAAIMVKYEESELLQYDMINVEPSGADLADPPIDGELCPTGTEEGSGVQAVL